MAVLPNYTISRCFRRLLLNLSHFVPAGPALDPVDGSFGFFSVFNLSYRILSFSRIFFLSYSAFFIFLIYYWICLYLVSLLSCILFRINKNSCFCYRDWLSFYRHFEYYFLRKFNFSFISLYFMTRDLFSCSILIKSCFFCSRA